MKTSPLRSASLWTGRIGVLGLLAVASCQHHGVCDDVAGSCLALRVEGDGPFDSLRTTLHLDPTGTPEVDGDTEGPIELPLTLRLLPPPNISSSTIGAVSVTGVAAAVDVATARSPAGFSWPDGSHTELTLRLDRFAGPSDGGVEDGGSADLPPPATDLAPLPDLSLPPSELTWRVEPSPGVGSLYGIWAGSDSQAYAVGDQGAILKRQPAGSWSGEPSGSRGSLDAVFGNPGGSVWAVGQTPGALRRDATVWSQDTGGLNLGRAELYSVTVGQTAGEVWAGDDAGRVWHRSGPPSGAGTWAAPEQVFQAAEKVIGIASAGGVVFAVGDNGKVAVRKGGVPAWQGYQYPALPSGQPFTVNGVWAFDKATAVAVGTGGLLVRYSAGAWQTAVQSLDAKGTELNGVWGLRPDRLWVVGAAGLVLRVEGTRTTQLRSSANQTLYQIFGLSETNLYTVGTQLNTPLILHATP